ncbi:MAG TPA: response regulator [Stellaceae bacterium]|jgi:FixJ family two-component response regulator|nr:response regulator [Stellaceae bacterium]
MIFIVDDDDATRDSLRLLLEGEGFAARDFASGRLFLDAVRPASGDCLVLDVNMPDMNGFDVFNELRRRGDALPIIFITAWPDPMLRSRARAAGAFALLEKPHRADELLALIRRAAARED